MRPFEKRKLFHRRSQEGLTGIRTQVYRYHTGDFEPVSPVNNTYCEKIVVLDSLLLLLLSATRFSSFHLSTSPWRRRRRQPPRESSEECSVLVFECSECEHRKADGFRSFALQTTATPRRQRRRRLRLRLRRLTSSTASSSRPRGAFLILLIFFISFVPAFCFFLYLCPAYYPPTHPTHTNQ